MAVKRASVVIIGIAVLVGGVCVASVVVAEGALHPPRRAVPIDPPRLQSAGIETVSIAAADRVALDAWVFTPHHPNGSAVLALHGIADNRVSTIAIAHVLTSAGYVVVAPDARAHGISGGFATYGVREADDVRRWIAFAASRANGCVYGFGESLGAAMLLQALDDRSPLCAVVAESAFTTFPDVAVDRIQLRLPVKGRVGRTAAAIVARVGLLYARAAYGVDLSSAAPVTAIARSRVPVLLIHGTDDVLAPVAYGERLRSANPAWTTLWVVPGAGHTQAWAAAGEAFPERVLQFFASHRDRSVKPD